jgi:hypothetical protein
MVTTTPATMGTPTPWYRAALILPIVPSVTSTTRRPRRISATMDCGIVAHKSKNGEAEAALFYARHFPCSTIGRNGLRAPSFTSFGRLFFWLPQLAGPQRAEMNRSPLRTWLCHESDVSALPVDVRNCSLKRTQHGRPLWAVHDRERPLRPHGQQGPFAAQS